MKHDFWIQRWELGEIGFHQDAINNYLINHWSQLSTTGGEKVFVPLCGKSKDMLWLNQQGHSVFGVELSELATRAFFSEHDLPFKESQEGGFTKFESDGYELWCGDFFDLSAEDLDDIRFVYDRASLVALPPEMRESYAARFKDLLVKGSKVLLVTMEYPQQEMNGPPFSVSEEEVNTLYQDSFSIECLETSDILEKNPRFKERGLSSMLEKSYLMVKK